MRSVAALACVAAFVVAVWYFGSGEPTPTPVPSEAGGPVAAQTPADAAGRSDSGGTGIREPMDDERGLVRGHVRTAAGAAWAGGEIRLRYFRHGEWDEEVVLEERSMRTDAAGAFAFRDGPRGIAALVCLDGDATLLRRDLLVPRRAPLELELPAAVPAAEATAVTTRAAGLATLSVVVRNPDGRPAAGVEVQMFDAPQRSGRRARTDARGRCRITELPACRFILTAESAAGCSPFAPSGMVYLGNAGYRAASQELLAGVETRVDLALVPWATIGGVAADAAGQPVPGASVTVAATNFLFAEKVPCDAAGRFSVRVRPGVAYRLHETCRSGFGFTVDGDDEPHLALQPGGARLDHEVRCRQPVPTRLTFRDAEGGPLPGVVVTSASPPGIGLSSNSRDYMIGSIEPQRSDAQGRVEFETWPGSYFLLFAHARGRKMARIYFDIRGLDGKEPEASIDREITMASYASGELRGIVVDAAGAPIEGAKVTASRGGKRIYFMSPESMGSYEPSGRRTTLTAETGRFVVTGLEAATDYELSCLAPGHGAVQQSGVRAGEEIQLQLPPPRRISGRVVLPSGAPVEGLAVALAKQRVTTDAGGRFELQVEARGEHRLYVTGPAIYQTTLDIDETAPAVHTITVQPRPWITGLLLDPAGAPLKHASLRIGLGKDYSTTWFTLETDAAGRYGFYWPVYQRREEPRRMLVARESLPNDAWTQLLAASLDPNDPPAELRFREGLRATVRVVDAKGRPIPEMFVSVPWGMGRASRQDANGRFRLWGLPEKRTTVYFHGSYETPEGERSVVLTVGNPEPRIRVRKRKEDR